MRLRSTLRWRRIASARSRTRRSDGFSYERRRFISRNVPSRCIFFFKTRSAALMSLSRTNTCMTMPHPHVADAAGRSAASSSADAAGASDRLQVHRRDLALLAGLEIVIDALALIEGVHPGLLDRGDVDEDILRAVLGLNEAVA